MKRKHIIRISAILFILYLLLGVYPSFPVEKHAQSIQIKKHDIPPKADQESY